MEATLHSPREQYIYIYMHTLSEDFSFTNHNMVIIWIRMQRMKSTSQRPDHKEETKEGRRNQKKKKYFIY